MPLPAVIVHAGAGNIAAGSSERLTLAATRAAASASWRALLSGAPAMEAVVAAIRVLEDDPACNAGLGSNLTRQGTVECDASVMDGKTGAWGGCGAVGGVANPVMLAHQLCEGQLGGAGPAGLVPPMLLVGRGALEHAVEHGIPTVTAAGIAEDGESDGLVTREARAKWRRYSSWLRDAEEMSTAARAAADENARSGCAAIDATAAAACTRRKRPASETVSNEIECEARRSVASACAGGTTLRDVSGVQDTVGAVAIDEEGHVAAGVSSGGAWLKSEGRIGEAAVYGAGCWVEENAQHPTSGAWGAGASVSGVGEQVRPEPTPLPCTLGCHVAAHLSTWTGLAATQVVYNLLAQEAARTALHEPVAVLANARTEGEPFNGEPSEGHSDGSSPDGEPIEPLQAIATRSIQRFSHRCGPPTIEPGAGLVLLRGVARARDAASGEPPESGVDASAATSGRDAIELAWAHSTPAMALAFLHHGLSEPVALVSRVRGTSGKREATSNPVVTVGGVRVVGSHG